MSMKAQVSHFSHASEFGGVDDCGYEETEGHFQEFVAEMEHFDEHISVHTIFQVASNFVDWLSERCIFMEDLVKNKAISRLGFQIFSRASDFKVCTTLDTKIRRYPPTPATVPQLFAATKGGRSVLRMTDSAEKGGQHVLQIAFSAKEGGRNVRRATCSATEGGRNVPRARHECDASANVAAT